MSVTLREKKIANGRMSLYLDFWPPIKDGKGGFTRTEYLKRYRYEPAKTPEQKLHNKENMNYANLMRYRREKEILNELDGIFNAQNKKKDFVEFFRDLCEKRKESIGNYGNWLSALKHLEKFTGGNCKFGAVNEDFCLKFKEYLNDLVVQKKNGNKGLSQNSAVSYFNKVRCAINEGFDARMFAENPLRHVKGLKQAETKRDFLTLEELQSLIGTPCELPRMKDAAIFSALTGLRWSDLTRLTWSDIQNTDGQYFVHIIQKKTNEIILHPISETAVKVLGEVGSKGENVFAGLKYSDRNNVKLKAWVFKAGITKKISFHNFRHTYASLLVNNGVDYFTVSKMLGHKNIQTTMLYTKLQDSTKIKAANLIDVQL